jgi:hypothetical protein
MAAGVIDAIRRDCSRVAVAETFFADSAALRIPSSLEVVRR